MSKRLLIETQLFTPTNVTNRENSLNGNMVVEGILATAEVKNGNGRYYPRELWERELNTYKQLIKEGRAVGELDHPECFIEGYKILTLEKGWIYFKDVEGWEKVATMNPISKNLEYQSIIKVINQPYKGDIINIESKTFQANVTPEHRFLVTNQYDIENNKPFKFKFAKDLNKGDLIPKRSEYIKDKIDNISIENEYGKINIPSSLFSSFMGWWLSEGWLGTKKYNKRTGYGIFISQLKKENLNELNNIYSSLSKNLNVKWNKYTNKRGETQYYIFDKVLYSYLSQFGLCDEKYIPKEIKELDKENIQIFLDSYLKGDGSKQYNQEVYYTTSYKIAEDLIELINLTGFMASISDKEMFYKKYLIEGKWIKDFEWYSNKEKYEDKIIENQKKHYTGKTLYSIRRKYSSYYHISDCNISTSQYDGNIYCISVPNETILVMSPNGSTFWSGNSSVINLKNVSHIVTDYWWDGDKVMGKLEILTTPSGNILSELIRNGILVGVSSRGMGSIEQKGTMMEVQDDFSLVCWDFVSTPSNPGSYMTLVKEGLDFDEKSINKYSKVNSIITDILCSQTGNCPCPQC